VSDQQQVSGGVKGEVEAKIEAMGLYLPDPVKPPPGVVFPFQFVRVVGDRAYVSGHGAQEPDGSLAGPFGKVGADVSEEEAYKVAQLVTVAMIASLKRELGDLNRIKAWLRVFGMVNSAPSFVRQPLVINGCSDLLFEVFGPERGQHARSAVGMASLPFDLAVEIEAEVLISV
jgi:enamine deaminase RidA (YjgF/YER057c/UK114 family)